MTLVLSFPSHRADLVFSEIVGHVAEVLLLFGECEINHRRSSASWWLGALFGLAHAIFAGTALVNVVLPLVHPRMGTPNTAADRSPLLEPPGFLLLNYGRSTPLVTVLAHIAFGAIVGEFIARRSCT
jgi:hypothetical protein